MKWISFKDELPKIDSLIIFGNHRMVEVCRYHPDQERIRIGMLHYKDITHWMYIDPPPVVEWESKWEKKPMNFEENNEDK